MIRTCPRDNQKCFTESCEIRNHCFRVKTYEIAPFRKHTKYVNLPKSNKITQTIKRKSKRGRHGDPNSGFWNSSKRG